MIHTASCMIDSEIAFLKKTLGNNKIIVEVGCFTGKTTCSLAENNVVIAIDPFISGYNPTLPYVQNLDEVEKYFISKIKNKNIIWHKKTSKEVLKFWQLMIDGVLIDSDHVTKVLIEDAKWIDYVKPDGIIAFHDYHLKLWPDVTDFVNKNIKPKYKLLGTDRFLVIFSKQ